MVFLRENTEGLYAGIGGMLAPGGTRRRRHRHARDHPRASERDHPPGVRDGACAPRRAQGRQEARHLHRQGQRAARLPASSATSSSRSARNTPRSRKTRHRRRLHPVADRPARVLRRAASPPTCSATSSPTWPACCRAAWAWRSAATSGDEHAMFEPIHGSAPQARRQGQGQPDRDDPRHQRGAALAGRQARRR